jgi:MYXO-CTERM domain-containing protein
VDQDRYAEIQESHACADTYCDWGECVITDQGAGCRCDEGFLARVFSDSDGQLSLTCVPETPRVDFAAGGIELDSSCSYDPAGDGECFDLGGFPAVACPSDEGAVIGVPSSRGPTIASCSDIVSHTSTQGATNYSSALGDLDVCAPPPPNCPSNAWLEELQMQNPGVECGDSPDPSWFVQPPKPECPEPSAAAPGTPSAAASGSPAVAPVMIVDTTEPRPELSKAPAVSSGGGNSDCTVGPPRRQSEAAAFALGLALLGLVRRRRGAVLHSSPSDPNLRNS